jgi:hypothetical protein
LFEHWLRSQRQINVLEAPQANKASLLGTIALVPDSSCQEMQWKHCTKQDFVFTAID